MHAPQSCVALTNSSAQSTRCVELCAWAELEQWRLISRPLRIWPRLGISRRSSLKILRPTIREKLCKCCQRCCCTGWACPETGPSSSSAHDSPDCSQPTWDEFDENLFFQSFKDRFVAAMHNNEKVILYMRVWLIGKHHSVVLPCRHYRFWCLIKLNSIVQTTKRDNSTISSRTPQINLLKIT